MMPAPTTTKLRHLNAAAIPEALRQQKRWAPWRAAWNEKRQKFDKVPHRADAPNYGISTAKPELWFSFDVALAAFEANPKLFAGIGYVMTGPHGVIGTDLDNCVENGVIAPWAQEVVAQLGSYTEISPSGNGLRILSAGEQTSDWNNHEIGIEVYGGNEARFLTVTGQHVAGTPAELAAPADGVLPALEARYAKERRRAEVIDLNMPDLIDDLLLPSLQNLDIPPAARDFLDSGAHRGDRSRELFATAVALYGAGLQDDEVFSILAQNEHAMEIALDHRRQDHDRALLYLWREQCCKGKARVPQRLTADDFEDVSPVSRDLSPVKEQRFAFQQAALFARRKPVSWLIKRVLPSTGLCVLFGESGSGKSFFTLDMAAAVARGVEWRSMRVKQGKVAYICAEGAGGFQNRLVAYAEHHGVDLADLDLAILGDAPNFMETTDVRDLVTSLKTLGPLAMVVIDTAARVMPGANENSGEDMGRVVKHCDLITRVTGALVVLVHHSGKDSSRGARGWSGLRAAADVEIEVVRASDEDRAATISKMKDAEDGAEFGFKLSTVPVAEDEDGETITSCVLQHTAAVPKAERKVEPKGSVERLVYQVLGELTSVGEDVVAVNTLVEVSVSRMVAEPDKRDRRREKVLRAIDSLSAANQVRVENGEVRCA